MTKMYGSEYIRALTCAVLHGGLFRESHLKENVDGSWERGQSGIHAGSTGYPFCLQSTRAEELLDSSFPFQTEGNPEFILGPPKSRTLPTPQRDVARSPLHDPHFGIQIGLLPSHVCLPRRTRSVST